MSAWGALEERDEGNISWWVPQDFKVASSDFEFDRAGFVDAIVNAMGCDVHEPSSRALEMDWEEVAADFLAASVNAG